MGLVTTQTRMIMIFLRFSYFASTWVIYMDADLQGKDLQAAAGRPNVQVQHNKPTDRFKYDALFVF